MSELEPDPNKQFYLDELNGSDLNPDPFKQFEKWFDDALKVVRLHPNALTLATADKDGKPSARMMLLKGFDENGFVFYTNSESRKGGELAENSRAAMVFWWAELERQVRIEGVIQRLSSEEIDEYFATRPRGSQLGAWASQQSRVIPSRELLDHRMRELEAEYKNRDVSRPPFWLGYCLVPVSIEFWQGRPNRLHDRFRYRLLESGRWIIERLSP